MGLADGFQKGFDWISTIANSIYNLDLSGGTLGWYGPGGSSSGAIIMSGTLCCGGNLNPDMLLEGFDWVAHYYSMGYGEGHRQGLSAGSNEGYSLTYPIAYAAAYPIGHLNGVGEGTRQGTAEGGDEGYGDGWDAGYGLGLDQGFDAGADYWLFGEFVEPRYELFYSPRSNALTARSLAALQAPEPASWALLASALVFGVLRRRK